MGDTSIHTNTKKIWKDVATSQSTEIKNNAPKTSKNLCHLHMSVTRSQSAGFGLKSTYSESIAASKPDWKALAEWQGMFCSSLLWTLWRSTYKIIQILQVAWELWNFYGLKDHQPSAQFEQKLRCTRQNTLVPLCWTLRHLLTSLFAGPHHSCLAQSSKDWIDSMMRVCMISRSISKKIWTDCSRLLICYNPHHLTDTHLTTCSLNDSAGER